MKPNILKGAFLEYIVRQILKNSGFTNCTADGLFTFHNRGLFFINGRGSAHDADVIMNPPIQIPFLYPTRLIFECKAYKSNVGLPHVRNALGLRNDINEFEIVTRESLKKRQKSKRSDYGIDLRNRYHYQVGVAGLKGFTKSAIEFATNNKIPLLSFSWLFNNDLVDKFDSINLDFLNDTNEQTIYSIYSFFKDRSGNLYSDKYTSVRDYLVNQENILSEILAEINEAIQHTYIGLLETGDILFLTPSDQRSADQITYYDFDVNSRAQLHFDPAKPDLWFLDVYQPRDIQLKFHLPQRILLKWAGENLSRRSALEMKQELFSRIYLINKNTESNYPLIVLRIDEEWLQSLMELR